MKRIACSLTLLCLAALSARAAATRDDGTDKTGAVTRELPSDSSLKTGRPDYAAAEKDLDATATQGQQGDEAVIETSHPYLLPRLFTIPTAYSLQSYEVRFGGQGNIQSALANLNTAGFKGSVAIGFGGIMELGYQLDEYYTVEDVSDKILMGYFKLSLLKESQYLPALAISASKNLRTSFHAADSFDYDMDEDMYEVVASKAFRVGDNVITLHPGAQIIRDAVTSVKDGPALADPYKVTKINPRLGISWQSRPKTLFMYELKILHPTKVSSIATGSIETDPAIENNLGVRYYIRNWLCIDAGIRNYYDMRKRDDEMKLHANFVGVVPLTTLYDRIEGYFKK